MDAPGGRDEGKELDPRVAAELERRPAREGSASGRAARAGQPSPRASRAERSAGSYEDRAEPRDDAVDDGG